MLDVWSISMRNKKLGLVFWDRSEIVKYWNTHLSDFLSLRVLVKKLLVYQMALWRIVTETTDPVTTSANVNDLIFRANLEPTNLYTLEL